VHVALRRFNPVVQCLDMVALVQLKPIQHHDFVTAT
jgi:hypothetical protein